VLTFFGLKIIFFHENLVSCSFTDTDLTYTTMHISYLSLNGQTVVCLGRERFHLFCTKVSEVCVISILNFGVWKAIEHLSFFFFFLVFF